MRIRYLIELVISIAFGFATVRLRLHEPDIDPRLLFNSGITLYGSFLTAFITGEVIFLYAEILTRRSPSIWGVGRFTCLLLGTTALIQWVAFAVSDVLRFLSDAGRVPTPQHLAEAAVFHSHLPVFYELSLLPAALWLAVAIGKIPRPESRDGREWCGRIFGLLVLFTRLASELINWLGYGFWLH